MAAAVVVAENRQSAAAMFSEILNTNGFYCSEVSPESMIEVDLNKANVYLLADGEY